MRKLSKTRGVRIPEGDWPVSLDGDRPGRIAGATVTTWPGAAQVDLMAVLTRAAQDGSISGAVTGAAEITQNSDHLSLSDGTEISFATVPNTSRGRKSR